MKMKVTLIGTCIMLFASALSAQNTNKKTGRLEFGVTGGLPTGGLRGATNLAIGLDLQAISPISKQAHFAFSFGLQGYLDKNGKGIVALSMPVLAGVQLYPQEKIFINTQIGLSVGGGVTFAYAAAVGARLSEKFSLQLRYQAAGTKYTYSFVGLRAGIAF